MMNKEYIRVLQLIAGKELSDPYKIHENENPDISIDIIKNLKSDGYISADIKEWYDNKFWVSNIRIAIKGEELLQERDFNSKILKLLKDDFFWKIIVPIIIGVAVWAINH